MSEAFFSNRPKPLTAAGLRAAVDRQLAELDRMAALPAGHPDILRAWGADQKVPVPCCTLHLFGGCAREACSDVDPRAGRSEQ